MVASPTKSTSDIHNKEHEESADAKRVVLVNSSGTIIKATTIPENRLGSECSGSSGATGRVLTLVNTSESGNPVSIWVEDQLINSADYTVSHLSASSTITFDNININDICQLTDAISYQDNTNMMKFVKSLSAVSYLTINLPEPIISLSDNIL